VAAEGPDRRSPAMKSGRGTGSGDVSAARNARIWCHSSVRADVLPPCFRHDRHRINDCRRGPAPGGQQDPQTSRGHCRTNRGRELGRSGYARRRCVARERPAATTLVMSGTSWRGRGRVERGALPPYSFLARVPVASITGSSERGGAVPCRSRRRAPRGVLAPLAACLKAIR